MRATWLTDIHLNFLRPYALQQFYAAVAAEQPDVLLITGDIAESDSVVRFVDELADAARAPAYFVLGNHDYYRSSIRIVREQVARVKRGAYLPTAAPVQLTERVIMVGIDGWGDARCGDLDATVKLSDWHLIDELKRRPDRDARNAELQRLGANEARALRERLAALPATPELLVLTHVPPFVEACVYDGLPSEPAWQPWFTCIATGEVLAAYAAAHPETHVTVLCGHSHGVGLFQPLVNLDVRTGGWPPGVEDYGNPIVQDTFEL